MKTLTWSLPIGAVLLFAFAACSSAKTPSLASGGSGGSLSMAGSGGDSSVGGASGGTASGGTASGGSGAVPEPGVLFIQEDEPGFSAVDGKILPREGSTSITGYTGPGFADGDSGVGKTISYSVDAASAGTVSLAFRYAFGGDATNLRDGKLIVNGEVVADPFTLPYTTTWNDWQETSPLEVELAAGPNFIVLEALNDGGIANIDYLKLVGEGLSGGTPRYFLSVDQNDAGAGAVAHAPESGSYAAGEVITLSALANPGFFFQSWSGDVTSPNAEHTFEIARNTRVTGLFLPEGTEQAAGLVGYATVQDDEGTPYVVTGGSLGESVTATTLAELETYLGTPEPLVVSFEGLFEGTESIKVSSNKTLLGVGDSAHLRGIELAIENARNVIVRNVKVSHVVADGAGEANDAVVISNSKNVWIDHCELFSDLDNGKDFYDGLLEIKNQAAFITVSWTVFHDHFKASLISSGDEQVGDSVIRATYHHNWFRDCGSRLPSIRFGKAHVFNNYYLDNTSGSCVNSRMGAVVKVEGNYFQNSKDTIGSWDSPMVGTWEVADNVFDACTGEQPTTSTGTLPIPYAYTPDAAADVPAIVAANAGVGKL